MDEGLRRADPPVRIRHAVTGAVYELLEDGTVLVTTGSGQQGVFDEMARWQGGDLAEADVQMTYWIAGPHASHYLDVTHIHVDVPAFAKRLARSEAGRGRPVS